MDPYAQVSAILCLKRSEAVYQDLESQNWEKIWIQDQKLCIISCLTSSCSKTYLCQIEQNNLDAAESLPVGVIVGNTISSNVILLMQAETQISKLPLQITYNGDFKVCRLFAEILCYDFYLIQAGRRTAEHKQQYHAMWAVSEWQHNIAFPPKIDLYSQLSAVQTKTIQN